MNTLNQTPEEIEKTEKQMKQRITNSMFHLATPAHSTKLRGIGYTRKSHAKSPAKRKVAKLSRRINKEISEKKFRPTGSKQRI
jgi:hypothetical protein